MFQIQAHVTQEDLEQMLQEKMEAEGLNLEGKYIEFTFVAGRNGKGMYVDIAINGDPPKKAPAKKSPKKTPTPQKVEEEEEVTQASTETPEEEPVSEKKPDPLEGLNTKPDTGTKTPSEDENLFTEAEEDDAAVRTGEGQGAKVDGNVTTDSDGDTESSEEEDDTDGLFD